MKSKGITIFKSMAQTAWLDELPGALKSSALSLYGLKSVYRVRRAVLPHAFQVAAVVATRDRGDCEVFVEARGDSLMHIHTECSCPVGRNCKHAYAALLAAVTRYYLPREDLEVRTDFAILETPLRVAEASGESVVELPPGVPRPVLQLRCEYPFTGYVGWYAGIPYGEKVRLGVLGFIYQQMPCTLFPWGGGEAGGDGWRRDMEAERAAAGRLLQMGFRRCGDVLNYSLKTELREALVAHQAPGLWMDFLLHAAPELRRDGWEVVLEDSFDLHILTPEYFYEELSETARPNWFAADIGVELEGKRVPLLPLLVRYLTSSPDGLNVSRLAAKGDEAVLIPLEDGKSWVPVPASRLHRIVTHLTELITAGARALDGTRLPLHRLRAAAFAGMEEDSGLFRRTHERLRGLAASLQAGTLTVDEAPPASLEADLRPYQLEGFRWLQFLARHGLGGVLADDMGLGKTVQTLAHLLAERESGTAAGPSLIVCPTSLLSNWRDEARRFTPSLRVRVHHGANRRLTDETLAGCDVLITSYPLLVRDAEALTAIAFHTVVLDEAQHIKNPRTLAAECACRLQSVHRLCLTGTPMENHLGELWSIYQFLMPGFLGTWDQFTTVFRTPIEKQDDRDRRKVLARRIAPVFLRRTKEAVLTDLPPKIISVQRIPLTPAQADLYESVRAAMDARIHEEIDRSGIARSQIYILDALLKLRQVCCHPALLKTKGAGQVQESAKLEALMDLVEPLVAEGRRMLVFSQFVEMLQLISARLKKEKVPHLMLTGETKQRGEMVTEFQSGTAPVFLISLKAGGTGLNLTAADTVIHYDPWWNPAAEAQASDRAHRFGQKSTVFVHKLICEGTIEERILQLQQRKAALIAGLMDGSGTTALSGLTAEDLDYLLAPVG
jgi:superfamily II DNA or RNA helicase